jgi:hypothetical protein
MIAYGQYSTDGLYGVDSAWEPDRGGWIKVHRAFLYHKHPLHPRRRAEQACLAFAWIDLVGHAEWQDTGELRRGQFSHAQSYFAQRWKWGVGKVSGFLEELEGVGMIRRVHQRGRKPDITTICNYDYYSTPEGTVRGINVWSK